MGQDNKYGRVVTERGDIADDEPVVVFRAQDGLLLAVLDAYREICERAGSPKRHLDLLADTRMKVEAWQREPANFVRCPPTSEGPAGQAWADRQAAT